MSDSINRPNDDQDYLEVSDDFDSEMDVIDNDFNEEDEDGIFAPEPNKAKKKHSIKLMLLLVLLAVVAGGGYFFTTLSSAPDNIVSPPLPDQAANTLPGVPQPVSDFADNGNPNPQTDQPPAPQADIILDQNAGSPEALPQLPDTNQDSAGVSEANANNIDAPHISDEQTKQDVSTEVPPSTEMPSIPPVPEQAPVAEQKLTDVPSTPPTPAITPPDVAANGNQDLAPQIPPQTPLEAAKNPITPPQPDASSLAAPSKKPVAETTTAETPLPVAAKAEKEAPKPKENSDNFYFDAPKGKALLDIPPPSIDPMREPGESIIIVRKPGQKNVAAKKTSTPDSNVIVEKSEDNQAIESRLVNANRASGLGMNDSALEFYNDLYRKNSRDPRILMGRAVTLQKLGENQKAIEYLEQALQIAREMGDRQNEGIHLGNLGNAYTNLGEYRKAIKYHEQALQIAREIGDRKVEGSNLGNLGSAYANLGEYQKAKDFYLQSIDILEAIGSPNAEIMRQNLARLESKS